MNDSFADHEAQAITEAIAAVHGRARGLNSWLSGSLLHNDHTRNTPLWLALCHAVLVRHRFLEGDTREAMSEALTSPALGFSHGAEPGAAALPTLTPARVAALAAGCASTQLPGAAEPADPQEALLVDLYTGHWPPLGTGSLDLTQLLVSTWRGAKHAGRLARLELWELQPRTDGLGPSQPSIVRAPGALLLAVDDPFAEGLHRAQRLLRRVLKPDAPSVAWNLRPLPSAALPRPPGLDFVEGNSATATFAFGALYLLRDHLRPEFAELAALLHDCEPATLTITAALNGPLAELDPAQPMDWPLLVRVDSVDDKFAALNELPTGRSVTHHYTAHDQHRNEPGHPPDQTAISVLGLCERIAKECNGGLSPKAQLLHRALLVDNLPVADMALMQDVARGARPSSIKAYLVWRYAERASGSHTAFGDPVRLDQHYVRLLLTAPDQWASAEGLSAQERQARAKQPFDLQTLLHEAPYASEPAWCVESPPLCGKTTLLARTEADTARRALQRRRRSGKWGEVCIFLPMRSFKPSQLPRDADRHARQKVVQDFIDFIDCNSPGLPPLADALQGRCKQAGLQRRLLIDGLNELHTDNKDERRAVVALLCTWMQQHQDVLLPPVFTVRELDNGLNLVSQDDTQWRAQRAVLQPWQRSDWRGYIALRKLQPQAQQRLHDMLRLDLPDSHDSADDTLFEKFCRSPGILAAQCTLLHRWPDLLPPRQRGTLFLALLWHLLGERGGELPEWLLPSWLRDAGALDEASKRNWRLPSQPGALIEHLLRQADAMQDKSGRPELEMPAHVSPPGLEGEKAEAWRKAVITLGLAARSRSGKFEFVHQQWLEFFAALGCGLEKPLPDLTPDALDPPDEAGLAQRLQQVLGSDIELPAASPHLERMRFAVELASDRGAWLRKLLRAGDGLAVAARVAAGFTAELEPDGAYPGEGRKGPHPVVQHLRRVLLLRSMDAGSDVRDRLYAGCVVGADENQAALAEHMSGFDDELNEHWQQEWRHLQSGLGRDLRHRLEAGFLLGDLTDNLRYQRVSGTLEDGRHISGVLLKPEQWLWRGEPGSTHKLSYRIGTDNGGEDKERPSWTKEYEPFQFARYPVTVEEWRWFVESGGYDPSAPWWASAGEAAMKWLNGAGGASRRPWHWVGPRFNNGLQPISSINWFEALAYAHWAQRLQWLRSIARPEPDVTQDGRIELPTEVRWEAGVWGPEAHPGLRGPKWVHQQGCSQPGLIDFNHRGRFGRTAPVGSYSRGAGPQGHFDTAGQVWEWCANALPGQCTELFADALPEGLLPEGWRSKPAREVADQPASATDRETLRALRGGDLNYFAGLCRPSVRNHTPPFVRDRNIGMRLVRVFFPILNAGHPELGASLHRPPANT